MDKYFTNKFIQNIDAFDKAKDKIKKMAFVKSNNSVLASIIADMEKDNK